MFTATGIDQDGDALTWSISGGADASRFVIDPLTGEVRFLNAPSVDAPADAGSDNVYDIMLTAGDGKSFSTAEAVAIAVTDVNGAPSVTSAAAANFAENGVGAVYTATGTDPDAGTILSWTLTGTDAALFNINAATGAVTFKAAPNFEAPGDAGANNVYDITVTASDGTLSSPARAVAITVTNVNATASVSALSASNSEGQAGPTAFTFTVTRTGDTRDPQALNWTIAGSGTNPAAALDFTGGALPTGTVSFGADETSKTITVQIAGDTSIEADEGFTITLSNPDTGLVLGTSSATGTILNDDPAATEGADTISGTPQNDTLQGLGGNDSLTGLAGDDVLNGGAGNDTMDGGAGADVALFTGLQAAYRFGLDGNILLVSGPDGTDRLSNIENLSFGGAPSISAASLQGAGLLEELVSIQNNGTTTKLLPDVYSGPVAWLEYAVLGSNTTDVAIGTSQNDFFNLLGGDDAANGGAGDDVIDGGTGSNFLTGGAGRDDFFLDGRGGSTTWATITDWEAGERLSVFGWRPGVSQVLWVDSAGAPGWTGVTMHGDLDGNGVIDTSVTWTGLTRDQLPAPLQFDGLLWFV